MDDPSKLEADLWAAADNLRANSKLTSSGYFMPVLGVIFLRHAANRFDTASKQIEQDQASGRMPKRKIQPEDYIRRRALWLPEKARYDYITEQASIDTAGLPTLVTNAMSAIEASFEPLSGVLPKDYAIFEPSVLERLMRLFNSEQIKRATGDIFGRIYEYFLAEFSVQKAHDNGEFFTPPSIVQTIVNVIEPDHGTVFDPACGSGGMFVQSSHFIEEQGADTTKRVVFYGQEKNPDTIRIAKMNLAVHGLEGHIAEAITYYQDEHELAGKCDFVMANPPFNVDLVDAERIKNDPRLPFGLPGVNKDKRVSNGNYLWISYFWSYLNDKGRAGFVMSSQASSAGHGEAQVRRKIIETGDVDVVMSIRSNFFYTRSVPCELWHFDRNKPDERRDKVLMIDVRNIYRKVTRKINDFSTEQQKNIAAIVWLYRGQTERFIALVQEYLTRAIAEAVDIKEKSDAFRSAYAALLDALPKDALPRESVKECDEAAKACLESSDDLVSRITRITPNELKLAAQKKMLAQVGKLATNCRDLVKDVDLAFKFATRAIDAAEKEAAEKNSELKWNRRAIGKLEKELDAQRKELIEQLKAVSYFERQANWLLSRFPDAQPVDVPGLVKLVDRKEIEAADWSLTPGRYVGVAALKVDEDFDFKETLREIHVELADLNREATELAAKIDKNFQELSV